jgi:hypothetical protein
MSTVLPLLLAGVLAAEGSLDLGVRTESSGRWTDPAPTPSEVHAIDQTASPHVALGVVSGPSSISAAYGLRLTVRDVGPDHRYEAMNTGEVRAALAPNTMWRLEAFAIGGLGRTDLVTVNRNARDASATTTVATTQPIDLRSLRSGLGVRLTPDTRNEWRASIGGSLSEGTDAPSRVALPLEREATADLGYGHGVTPRDWLTLGLSTYAGEVPAEGTTSGIATATTGWRHNATPTLVLRGSAGAVEFFTSVPGGSNAGGRVVSRHLRPAAELGLTSKGESEPVSVEIDGRLGASSDRLTGVASQDFQAAALLGWRASQAVGFRARATGAVAWPPTGTTRRGGVDLGATVAFLRRTSLEVSAYGAWQRSSDPNVPTFREYGFIVGLAIDAPTLRF